MYQPNAYSTLKDNLQILINRIQVYKFCNKMKLQKAKLKLQILQNVYSKKVSILKKYILEILETFQHDENVGFMNSSRPRLIFLFLINTKHIYNIRDIFTNSHPYQMVYSIPYHKPCIYRIKTVKCKPMTITISGQYSSVSIRTLLCVAVRFLYLPIYNSLIALNCMCMNFMGVSL